MFHMDLMMMTEIMLIPNNTRKYKSVFIHLVPEIGRKIQSFIKEFIGDCLWTDGNRKRSKKQRRTIKLIYVNSLS